MADRYLVICGCSLCADILPLDLLMHGIIDVLGMGFCGYEGVFGLGFEVCSALW